MKKLMILAAVAAMTSVAIAEFGTIGMSAETQDSVIGRDVSPALIRSIEVWSTKQDADVNISRIRTVDAYTNCYDITVYTNQQVVKVVDNWHYYYTDDNGRVFTSTNFTDKYIKGKYAAFTFNADGSESTETYPYLQVVFAYGVYQTAGIHENETEYYTDPKCHYGTVSDWIPSSLVFQKSGYSNGLLLSKNELEWHYETNNIPCYVTNRVWKAKSGMNCATNTIVSSQCQNGFISVNMTNDMFVVYGDTIHVDGLDDAPGTSTYMTLIYEK